MWAKWPFRVLPFSRAFRVHPFCQACMPSASRPLLVHLPRPAHHPTPPYVLFTPHPFLPAHHTVRGSPVRAAHHAAQGLAVRAGRRVAHGRVVAQNEVDMQVRCELLRKVKNEHYGPKIVAHAHSTS
jgi:hypothetical protein